MAELFLGGLFNNVDPIFGLPLYIWEFVGSLVIIGITHLVLKSLWWTPHTPLHGLYYGWKNGSGCSFIADKNLIAEMVAENIAKCIFDYGEDEYEIDVPYADNPAIGWLTRKIYKWAFYYPSQYIPNLSWKDCIMYKFGGVNRDVEIAKILQKGDWDRYPAVICGGVPVDIVIDTDNWTIRTSPQHRAIVKSARAWNKEHPDDQVHTYSKYQRYLDNGNIEKPTEIQQTFTVSWTRIKIGFPLDLEENDWAGKRRQMALEKRENPDGLMNVNKMALYIFLAGLGLSLVIVAVRFISFLIVTSKP